MINASIEIDKNLDQIEEIFKPELEKASNERATLKIKKTGKKLIFYVNAADIVALRATLNSITKMLEVNYKINQLK